MALPRPLQLLPVLALLLAGAAAQTIVLTPGTTVLSSTGGNVTFTATLNYTAPPSTLGLTITLPTGWTYLSGTTVPGTSPAEPVIAPATGRTGQLEWAFVTPPATPAAFTFVVSYPGTATGVQQLSPTLVARDGTGAPATTVTPPALQLSAPSTIATWAGGSGDWSDSARWTDGTVPLNSGTTRFSATVASGIANLNTTVNLDNLTFTGGTIAGSHTLTLLGLGSTWTSGIFDGAGELVVAAGARIAATGNAAHAFPGRTIRNSGTFVWSDAGALQSGSGGSFVNASGATFTDGTPATATAVVANTSGGSFSFTNAGTYRKDAAGLTRFTVPFSNTGNLLVTAGTLRFEDAFTHSAGTIAVSSGATARFDQGLTVATGTLRGAGTVVGHVRSEGVLQPGDSTGKLTIDGNLTLVSTSQLLLEIGGTVPGSGYDWVSVSGTALLAGTLSVTVLPGAVSTLLPGDTFTILSATSLSGTFANAPADTRFTTVNGNSFLVSYTGTSVLLTQFDPIPEPSTWALLVGGAAALGLGALRRRRR